MTIPGGEHEIEFKFEPEIIKTGSQITLISCIALGLVIIGGIGFSFRSKKSKKE